jgi:NAD-dependent dihydropyrimidine dehydrogenase PreA subunit
MTNLKRWEDANQWIEVDMDLCTGAGDCANACPSDAYQISDGKLETVYIGDCSECGACQDECPHNAILSHWAWG